MVVDKMNNPQLSRKEENHIMPRTELPLNKARTGQRGLIPPLGVNRKEEIERIWNIVQKRCWLGDLIFSQEKDIDFALIDTAIKRGIEIGKSTIQKEKTNG